MVDISPELQPIAYDSHHCFWRRREYTTPIERQVRNMGAFIIRVNVIDHRELHANVPPPPKPEAEQMHDLYQFMQEHSYDIESLDGLLWGICWANDRRLYELEDNMEQQYYYCSGDYRRS